MGLEKKRKQKYQPREVEEKVESAWLWDEGKQKLGQATREWEKREKGTMLFERHGKKSAVVADFFWCDFCHL